MSTLVHHTGMKFYTGFNAGYNNDDFVRNRVTFFKKFEVEGVRYRLMYITDQRTILIVKSISGGAYEQMISTVMIDDCYFDLIEKICTDFKNWVPDGETR